MTLPRRSFLLERLIHPCALFMVGLAIGWVPADAANQTAHAAAARPNIIYIMADDLGYADIGPFGQKKIRTPNLDRMAAEGTCFDQFYPGAAVCAPTRSTLMTGLHTGHTRVRGNHGEMTGRVPLRAGDTTVAEVLKRAGYATGMVGKWGLGEPGTTGVPNKKGFDFWFGYLNQDLAEDYYPEKLWRNDREVTLPGNVGSQKEQFSNDLFTEEALAFMAANRGQPFFLYMAYTIPHLVWEVPADSLREYESAFPEKPDRPRKSDAMVIAKPFATYAAMVTRLDGEVGRVFQKLRDLGLDQNTVVFFCSDNGAPDRTPVAFFQSNGPFRGFKGSLYEGGIHTEMIVRWPGQIPAGKRSGFAWAGWDFLPTAAELAGASVPLALDGISVVPALLGKAAPRPGYLYWEIPAGSLAQAVRLGDLKAIRLSSDQPVAVYDLAKDPGEQHDVASTHRDFVIKAGEIFREARTPSEEWPVGQEPGAKPGKKKERR